MAMLSSQLQVSRMSTKAGVAWLCAPGRDIRSHEAHVYLKENLRS